MRTTTFHKPKDIEVFKQNILLWSQRFDDVVWLDSNNHKDQYSSYDAVLPVDAFTALKTDYFDAFENLKENGELVYSTCSLEPEENEGVVHLLLEKFADAKIIPVKLPGLKVSPPVKEFKKVKFNSQVKDCIRLWPQDNDTEGFFVAKIRKNH